MTFLSYAFVVVAVQFVFIIYLFIENNSVKSTATTNVASQATTHNPSEVASFYNAQAGNFQQVYGDIIQSFRTKKIEDYLNYTIQSAGLTAGQMVLDAGCGVGGPAMHFAKCLAINIHGCTISMVQAEMANKKIEDKNLSDKIKIRMGDYHRLDDLYEKNKYDTVLFLESFGYSNDISKVLKSTWEVLKPGGVLYIKDLFEKETNEGEEQDKIHGYVQDINEAYKFNIGNLHTVLSEIRKIGFILLFIKAPEVNEDDFENFAIADKFQDLFKINRKPYTDWVFPVDYLEIKCMKPAFDLNKDKHLHFLAQGINDQNFNHAEEVHSSTTSKDQSKKVFEA